MRISNHNHRRSIVDRRAIAFIVLQRINGKNHLGYLAGKSKGFQMNGIRIEPGMSVEVVTNSFSNPLLTNGGQPVADAFMRIYGIDIRRAGIMSQAFLDVERLG